MHSSGARPDTQSSDIEFVLIGSARAGDAAAFGELVRIHMKRAYIVAYRLLHNHEDAEDLVQDAFGLAFARLETCQPGRPFAPWFFRILVNRGLNIIESQRVRATSALDYEVAAEGIGPDEAASESELVRAIRAAMHALPARQRTLVELVELEGFTPSEAAQYLSIAPATARWHLHTARQTLQELLAQFR
jgi:RNA polymerase sigma-70 factor, ECF subfamily